ncbi:MAG: hypothetical protein ACI9FR_002735 [Cryomorphaceae bacterium]
MLNFAHRSILSPCEAIAMTHVIQSTFLTLVISASISPAHAQQSAHEFFSQLSSLCHSQYVGEMTYPIDGQDSFAEKSLVAEITTCDEEQVRVPFSVGEDKSRTWVFTKTESGVSLKHDHRHADGSVDDVSNYGGNSNENGSVLKQSFPADQYTQELIPDAATNVWSVSLNKDGSQLTYHLDRHNKPRFTAVLYRK